MDKTKRKRWMVLAIGLVIVGLLFVALPWLLFAQAEKKLDDDPCAFGDKGPEKKAPKENFFSALDTLKFVENFPGFGSSAKDLAMAAASRCLGNFSIACSMLRYQAEDKARQSIRNAWDAQYDKARTEEERERLWKERNLKEKNLDWQPFVSDQQRTSFCQDWSRWDQYLVSIDVEVWKLCPVCHQELRDDSSKRKTDAPEK